MDSGFQKIEIRDFPVHRNTNRKRLRQGGRLALITLVLAILGGCLSLPVNKTNQLLGTWRSEVGGFPVVVAYSETTVRVAGYNELPYQFEHDSLVIAGDVTQTRIVSFPSADEMVHTDPLTGTEQRFSRIP